MEYHIEHDFSGYILGKIPLLNALNYNLIVGLQGFATKDQKPYKEFSLGIDNIVIELSASEVPIMDGSSFDFVEAIRSVGTQDQNAQRKFIKITF